MDAGWIILGIQVNVKPTDMQLKFAFKVAVKTNVTNILYIINYIIYLSLIE